MDTLERQEPDSVLNPPAHPVTDVKASPVTTPHDPYVALRFRDYRLLIFGRFVATLGDQMAAVAIGWELYERTGSALSLGLVGLVQIIPVILLVLPAGHVVDRSHRKGITMISEMTVAICAFGLALLTHTSGSLVVVYALLFYIAVVQAFGGPATSAMLPQTVPPEAYANAATWSSSAWQFASVFGPALGGLIIALRHSATLVFVFQAMAALFFFVLLLAIRVRHIQRAKEPTSLKSMMAGAVFIWRTKVMLAAATLDMFAVLLGGATALLPVYAKDILRVGPEGLGWLRAGPSIGALATIFIIAYLPPFKHAGRTLLLAVAGFGIATIIFGLSTWFPLSMVMLILLGAFDSINVVIRQTLFLVYTPDQMRGRTSAVNSVFVGSSNQLGEFESGIAASLFGPVIAVVAGGIGTILVVLSVARIWPEVRRLGSLGAKMKE